MKQFATAVSLIGCMLLSGPLPAWAVTVGADQGVRLLQQDFVTATGTLPHIDTGTLSVDLVRLRQATGLASGWLNMRTAHGWVVRNLPVPVEEAFPYGRLSADFDLGVASGTAVPVLDAAIDYAATPSNDYTGGVLQTHALAALTVRLGGADNLPVSGPPSPPNHTGFNYGSSTRADEITVQPDHPNIEAAQNQCFPASVANSLQYLKNRYGLAVPHANKPGLRPSASPGDDSLVGQIDEAMNRQVTDRRTGQGIVTGGLKGKLNYIARNKLHQRLQVTHYGSFNGDDGGANMSSDTIDGARLSSTGAGARVNLDAVYRALAAGENCEAIYSWSATLPDGTVRRGAHAVDLVGGSSLMGRRSLAWASDRNQDSDSAGAGLAGVENVEVDGPDANGQYNLGGGSNRRLRLVICEKFVPAPLTRTVTRVLDPRGHACCVDPPPASLNIALANGAMTLSGSGASWLPMTGSLANGNFDLTSRATVAGFANVTSRFTGTYAAGRYEGTLTVGAAGELFGVPISYDLRIDEGQVSQIMPAMRLNGLRQAARLMLGDPVKPSISMGAGPFVGRSGDWFLVAGLADGRWLRFDLATMAWVPGLEPSYTGPLFELPFFGLPVMENLPAGTHAFYFGFDTRPNGQLDLDAVVYERTELTVADPAIDVARRR